MEKRILLIRGPDKAYKTIIIDSEDALERELTKAWKLCRTATIYTIKTAERVRATKTKGLWEQVAGEA